MALQLLFGPAVVSDVQEKIRLTSKLGDLALTRDFLIGIRQLCAFSITNGVATYFGWEKMAYGFGLVVYYVTGLVEHARVERAVRQIFVDRFNAPLVAGEGVGRLDFEYLARSPKAVKEWMEGKNDDEIKRALAGLWTYVASDVTGRSAVRDKTVLEGLREPALLQGEQKDSVEVLLRKKEVLTLLLEKKVSISADSFYGMLLANDQTFVQEVLEKGEMGNFSGRAITRFWSAVWNRKAARLMEEKFGNINAKMGLSVGLLMKIQRWVQRGGWDIQEMILLLDFGAEISDLQQNLQYRHSRKTQTVEGIRKILQENPNFLVNTLHFAGEKTYSAERFLEKISGLEETQLITCSLIEEKTVEEWIKGTKLEVALGQKGDRAHKKVEHSFINADIDGGQFEARSDIAHRVKLLAFAFFGPIALIGGLVASVNWSPSPLWGLSCIILPLGADYYFTRFESWAAANKLREVARKFFDARFVPACVMNFIAQDGDSAKAFVKVSYDRLIQLDTEGRSMWDRLLANSLPLDVAETYLVAALAEKGTAKEKAARFVQIAEAGHDHLTLKGFGFITPGWLSTKQKNKVLGCAGGELLAF